MFDFITPVPIKLQDIYKRNCRIKLGQFQLEIIMRGVGIILILVGFVHSLVIGKQIQNQHLGRFSVTRFDYNRA